MDSHISKTLGDFATRLTEMEQNSVPSPHVCASSRRMLPQHQMFPVRQHPGLHSNTLTTPQPQGPMAQSHLMTTETHDEDLILPQAQKMNNHEVPSYFDSLASNTSKELQSGSIPFGKSPICWYVTNLSEFIAKQVPCQSGLLLKHAANAKTLLLDIRMMAFLMQLTVTSAAPTLLSQCVNPDQLKTERLENNLCRCGKSWLTSLKFFPDADCEGVFIIPATDPLSQILSIKDRRNGIGKAVFKLAPLGSGQTFTLVAPDLSVPGISPKVLQRVLSQANRPHV